jgi:mono/diheme cytochrome c family protein
MNNKAEQSTGFLRYSLLSSSEIKAPIISITFLFITFLFIFSILAVFSTSNVHAAEIDWGQVDAKTIKTFYPGVSSWDFMKGKDHGTGANVVKKMGKSCADCHVGKDGSYDIKSDQIISGELKMVASGDAFEPEPLTGMPGFKDVSLQAAYDAENIYLRLQWPGSGASTSEEDADRVSIQIANKIKSFNLYGCFVSCHDDQSDMPENRGEEKKLYGYFAKGKSQDKLDGYLSKGQFLDLWEASFVGTEVKTEDYYVLEDRHEDQNDLTATGNFEGGKYTVVFTRKLSTGDAKDIKLQDGKRFSIGISIHDNKNKGRKHYVSFPVSIGLSTSGDVTARKF